MRKHQKQQILEIIQSMHMLHVQIRGKLSDRDYDIVQTALTDCQEAAIQIGEVIEQIEGTGTQAVIYLEQYCENIYQTSVQMQELSAQKAYKSLEGSLIKAQNAVSHMEERKEVVFLPYKASMWDSLESVWKAADEDTDCDAYVIPIPYYDKNPDGSFKEMHYEGDQYPEYVPVTPYGEYDFANRKPDAIYIHNPYDEFNYVTSVHPFFYAKNLRKYTDKLVYIPYFILKEISPDDSKAIEGMEHFCTVPGVFYADQVIVQSEDMRTIYIHVLTKEFGEESRRTWETKILGLGSPKMDKVMRTQKEDIDIPEEWLKIIQKPDGSYKKIVFYNTSINALLYHEDKMLAKMQDVFHMFKENQDEVVLLWRPHPLIKSTIESMRPKLWEAYEQIVEQYLEEGWGIYDDTSDLNRAIALCDAYYGDGSSVVQLCQKAGKVTMLQTCEAPFEKAKMPDIYPDSDCIYVEDGIGWFISRVDNFLYKIDIKSHLCTFISKLPESGIAYWRGNSICYKRKNDIICLPDRSAFIWVYHLDHEEFEQIEMPQSNADRWDAVAYVEKDEYVYILSRGAKAIAVVDIDNLKVVRMININHHEKIESICGETYGTSIFFVINGEHSSVIYEFDSNAELILKCCEIEVHDNYNTISFDGENFWLSGKKRQIVTINKESLNCRILKDFPEAFCMYNIGNPESGETEIRTEEEEYPQLLFFNSFVHQSKIWFVPLRTSHIISVNRSTYAINAIELENETETMESLNRNGMLRNYKFFFEWIQNDTGLVFYSFKNDCHYIIDGETENCIGGFKDYQFVNYAQMLDALLDGQVLHENKETDKELFRYKLFEKEI